MPDRDPPWLEGFIARERLTDAFRSNLDALYWPLVSQIESRLAGRKSPLVVGLCGPQGSGKSTGAAVLARLLGDQNIGAVVLALDDLYLRRSERLALAERVHPLLATRGPPGTHLPSLGRNLIDALSMPTVVRLPRFDKALDDRSPEAEWPLTAGPMKVILFEGWCVGARPQAALELAAPINALERDEDPQGVWRSYVNAQLAGHYRPLFDRIDLLVLLRAPAFAAVQAWRLEQEHKLAARRTEAGDAPGLMSDEQVARFIQHYERLIRHIDAEMPARADVVVQLAKDRRVVDLALT